MSKSLAVPRNGYKKLHRVPVADRSLPATEVRVQLQSVDKFLGKAKHREPPHPGNPITLLPGGEAT